MTTRTKHLTSRVDDKDIDRGLNGALPLLASMQMVVLIGGAMQVPILALVTVMPNALMILSSSTEKPMRMIGFQVDDWVPSEKDESAGRGKYGIAQKLICGKKTRSPRHSRCIPVTGLMNSNTDALEMIVVTMVRLGSRVCMTRMVATSKPEVLVNAISMDLVASLTLIPTVSPQFITDDGTDDGTIVEARQFYTQNGKTHEHKHYAVNGNKHDSITDWVPETTD